MVDYGRRKTALTEVPQQSLHRPRGGISQCADRVSLDFLGQLLEHLNLALMRPTDDEAVHHLLKPGGALTARRALTARLVLVELWCVRRRGSARAP